MELIVLCVVLWTCLRAWAQNPGGGELQYTVVEELPQGSFVANIFQDSNIQQRYDASEVELMRFRFLGEPQEPFVIEEETGIIRTGGNIDRDIKCPNSAGCFTKLDVVALVTEPMKFYEIIKVRVEITDINDNSPQFPEPEITHHVLESASPGASYVIPTAADPDSGQLGIQGYRLVPTSGIFRLEVKQKLDGSTDVRLVLSSHLDREKEDLYRVKVIAYDGGNPPKSGTVDVIIRVQDANDNDPVFENSTYIVNIPENIPIQSTILAVRARDRDSGLYGQILYMFSDRTKKQHGHLFGVRNTTGELFVKGVIDYEEGAVYHLSVIARDRGPDSLPADTTVIVRILDINDHSPAITVNTLSATGTDKAVIAEDAALNTFVAHLMVVDKDSGRNGNFSCHLNDNHFKLEDLYQGEYKIVTWAPLDRETRAQYNLAITCKDHGREPQVSIKHIQVSVTDVNDNLPVFSQESYLANLEENSNIGTYITRVNATDSDVGTNAQIWYKLHDDAGDSFHVDPVSGVITAAAVFDHEKSDYKQFHILAVDKGAMASTGTAMVIVHINDENDASPLFTQPSYSFGVLESENPGTEVGVVAASDADGEPHNIFTFSLMPSMDAVNNFDIDRHTGRITTKVSLDREAQPAYYIVVVATDSGIPPLSSSVTATVYVTDKNDNAPVFDYPSRFNNTIYVSNRVPVGYTITKVTAHDMDIGNNGNLSYFLSRGNEEGVFSIDPRSGKIKVNSGLKKNDYKVYELAVTVKDHGVPERTAITNFNIVVNKSIPFQYADTEMLSGYNLTIVIAVACGLGLVMMILVIAILIVLRRQSRDKKIHKYNCRTEALKMLQAKEAGLVAKGDGSAAGKEGVTAPADNQVAPGDDDKPRKEVSFSLNVSDEDGGSKHSGMTSSAPPGYMSLTAPSAHQVALSAGQGHQRPVATQHTGQNNVRPWTFNQKELEVHQVLGMIKQDQDADSAYSGESSNTDSGRGISEEGDGVHRNSHDPYSTGAGPHSGSSGEAAPAGNHTFQPTHSYSSSQPHRMQTFSPKNKPSPHGPTDPPGNSFVQHHNYINSGHHHGNHDNANSQYGHHGYSAYDNPAGHYGGRHGYPPNKTDSRTSPYGTGDHGSSYANPGTGTYGRTHYRMPQVPESIPENLDSPSNPHRGMGSNALQIEGTCGKDMVV